MAIRQVQPESILSTLEQFIQSSFRLPLTQGHRDKLAPLLFRKLLQLVVRVHSNRKHEYHRNRLRSIIENPIESEVWRGGVE